MQNTPEIQGNPSVIVLPVIWFIFIIIALFVGSLYLFSGSFPRQFTAAIVSPTITPVPTTVITPTPSPVPTKVIPTEIIPRPTKVAASCVRLNIREGEFASNKCYSRADYDNLYYYLQKYNSAKFELQIAQGTIGITCNCRNPRECDFFKESCSSAQKQKTQAESDINKYRSLIQTIIARGK